MEGISPEIYGDGAYRQEVVNRTNEHIDLLVAGQAQLQFGTESVDNLTVEQQGHVFGKVFSQLQGEEGLKLDRLTVAQRYMDLMPEHPAKRQAEGIDTLAFFKMVLRSDDHADMDAQDYLSDNVYAAWRMLYDDRLWGTDGEYSVDDIRNVSRAILLTLESSAGTRASVEIKHSTAQAAAIEILTDLEKYYGDELDAVSDPNLMLSKWAQLPPEKAASAHNSILTLLHAVPDLAQREAVAALVDLQRARPLINGEGAWPLEDAVQELESHVWQVMNKASSEQVVVYREALHDELADRALRWLEYDLRTSPDSPEETRAIFARYASYFDNDDRHQWRVEAAYEAARAGDAERVRANFGWHTQAVFFESVVKVIGSGFNAKQLAEAYVAAPKTSKQQLIDAFTSAYVRDETERISTELAGQDVENASDVIKATQPVEFFVDDALGETLLPGEVMNNMAAVVLAVEARQRTWRSEADRAKVQELGTFRRLFAGRLPSVVQLEPVRPEHPATELTDRLVALGVAR